MQGHVFADQRMERLIKLRGFHEISLGMGWLEPGREVTFGHDRLRPDSIGRKQNLQGAGSLGWFGEIYLSSTFRSVASSRTNSAGTPFVMSGRVLLPSKRSDAFTRVPNNTTARARS